MTQEPRWGGQAQIVSDSVSKPVVLSQVQFPLRPTVSPSSSSPAQDAQQYKHVLTSTAISPQMDLVAMMSRDIAAATAGIDDTASIPPPPPGMSAAANQARMRMIMMARARKAMAGGKGGPTAATTTQTPKVFRSPPLRLSVWRMSSTAGELGSTVWDTELKGPDLFEDLGKEYKELEDLSASALCWSPDGQCIAVTLLVTRLSVEDRSRKRSLSFLLLYNMQDGKQLRVMRLPSRPDDATGSLYGLRWQTLAERDTRPVPGSALYLLEKMGELPDTSKVLEEKKSGIRQRQKALNSMRNTAQKQGGADQKVEEVMPSLSNRWSLSLLDHPRSRSSLFSKAAKEGKTSHILYAWGRHDVHLVLDATIYLGSLNVAEEIIAIDFISQDGTLFLSTKETQATSSLTLQKAPTLINSHSVSFSTILHLQPLSTFAFQLLTYTHDTLMSARHLYRTTHSNCITPWIKVGRAMERKYSTNFWSEMQMLLLTSSANEAITSVLTGNETITEGDLNKFRVELASAWKTLEALAKGVFQALQRVAIVMEEVKGCSLWPEKFGNFLDSTSTPAIQALLDLVCASQKQTLSLLRHIQQEMTCWTHFYRWFKFEKTRQETVRDQLPEPKTDVTYDVVLIVDFLCRGFVNYAIEATLGIVLDSKTRGTFVEDDEEEDVQAPLGNQEVQEGAGQRHAVEFLKSARMDGQARIHEKFSSSQDSKRSLSCLAEELQQPPASLKVDDGDDAPCKEDIATAKASAYILTGPSKGMHLRSTASNFLSSSLPEAIKDIVEISSSIFSHAFACFTGQQKLPYEKLIVPLPQPLEQIRSDSLISLARSDSTDTRAPEEKALFARTCIDQGSGKHWLLGISHDENGRPRTVLLLVHNLASTATQIGMIRCDADIIDLGFYSSNEVVILMRTPSDMTRVVSFRLDQQIFVPGQMAHQVPLQRCYEVQPDEAGSGAVQLSLNHIKDVAAALDDQGQLVYWDFVWLGDEERDEDYEMN